MNKNKLLVHLRNSFLVASLFSSNLFAQSTRITPIAPDNPTNINDLGELINRGVEIAMFFIAIVAVLYIIVSGFNYIMAGGDDKKAGAARKGIQNAIIGIIIAFVAFLIVKFVLINFLDVRPGMLGGWESRTDTGI